jgi:hypothetical protein
MSKRNRSTPEQAQTVPATEQAAPTTEQAIIEQPKQVTIKASEFVKQFDQNGTRNITPAELASAMVAKMAELGAKPKAHNQDALQFTNVGENVKPYRVRASAVSGAKNENVGRWELMVKLLAAQGGKATQAELVACCGSLVFVRYCINNDWLVKVS